MRKESLGSSFLYMAAGLNGVYIYNIDDPKKPILTSAI
jgi:hypothetical protein